MAIFHSANRTSGPLILLFGSGARRISSSFPELSWDFLQDDLGLGSVVEFSSFWSVQKAGTEWVVSRVERARGTMVWTHYEGNIIVTNWPPFLARIRKFRPNMAVLREWVEGRNKESVEDFLLGVQRVPCGKGLSIERSGVKQVNLDLPAKPFTGTFQEAVGLLRETLEEALPSDQKLAVALSGGVDSGIIAGLASKSNALRLFTMSSEIPGTNELEATRETARYLANSVLEFPIDSLPVLQNSRPIHPYWGPRQQPTEDHEHSFFEWIAGHGYDQIWTGIGADQLCDVHPVSSDLDIAFNGSPGELRALSLSPWRLRHVWKDWGKRDILLHIASRDWDLSCRQIQRIEFSAGLRIQMPFLADPVMELVQTLPARFLRLVHTDKRILRALALGLIPELIRRNVKSTSFLPTIQSRLGRETPNGEFDQGLNVRIWREFVSSIWLQEF